MNLFRLIILAVAFICTPIAHAACSPESVKGRFAASGTVDSFGFVGDGKESNLIFLMGIFNFDGAERVTVRNGKISIAGVFGNASGAGSYRLNANCAGTATITLNIKIPDQPNAFEQPIVKTRIRFDLVVSGTSNDPRISAVWTDILEGGESGLLSLKKIRL